MSRRGLAALALTLALGWSAASAGAELLRAWRTLPPRFERMAGALRWHDREARRLRAFVAAARDAAPPELGRWCWFAPSLAAGRQAEVFRWAAFLAPSHELQVGGAPTAAPCDVEVMFWPAGVVASSDSLPAEILLEHRLGRVRRLSPSEPR